MVLLASTSGSKANNTGIFTSNLTIPGSYDSELQIFMCPAAAITTASQFQITLDGTNYFFASDPALPATLAAGTTYRFSVPVAKNAIVNFKTLTGSALTWNFFQVYV
jgi:hypothetical protein